MSWIDVEGVEHVSGSDVTSERGDEHIRGCKRCQAMFPMMAAILRMGAE